MEIILLEDVKSLGKKGEIVKINEGYARNFVLPKKLGLEASPKNLNDLKLTKVKEARLAQEELDAAKELALKVAEKPVKLSIKMGEGGRTFGSISTKEIAIAVQNQLNLEIDKKKMHLEDAIKTLGTHSVSIKLHKDVTAQLTVVVTEAK